jgi:hypothetical protein
MEAVSSNAWGSWILNLNYTFVTYPVKHQQYLRSSLTYKVLLNVSKNIIMGDTPTRSASYILILWSFGKTLSLNKRHKTSSKRGCVAPV